MLWISWKKFTTINKYPTCNRVCIVADQCRQRSGTLKMDSTLYMNETVAYNVQTDYSQVSTRAPCEAGSISSYQPTTQPRQHNWTEPPLNGLSEVSPDNLPSAPPNTLYQPMLFNDAHNASLYKLHSPTPVLLLLSGYCFNCVWQRI